MYSNFSNLNARSGFDKTKKFGGFGGGQFKRKTFQPQDINLQPVDWSKRQMRKFEKNFYVEHPAIKARTKAENDKIYKELELTVKNTNLRPVSNFDECGLPSYITQLFTKEGFTKPTPIQCQSWPVVLSGKDLIGVASTGSGKTLGFLIPSIIHINAQEALKKGDGPVALIVAPTRELVLQIEKQVEKFVESSKIRYTSVYGGIPRGVQRRHLENGVDIIVATPGRLLDFLSSNTTNLNRVTYLVLDEADRMLDMGFEKAIRNIIGQIRPDRQTLLFSATWPKSIQRLANEFLTNPSQINVGSMGISSCKNVEQKFEVVDHYNKRAILLNYVNSFPQSTKILIFVATKKLSNDLSNELNRQGVFSDSINGDKSQAERERVLQQFRKGEIYILIGTDVASRGIDIKDINVVVNYDFPNTIEDYVHRVGRTGRASAKGESLTLLTHKDSGKAQDIVRLLNNDKKPIPPAIQKLVQSGKFKGGNNNNSRYGRGGDNRYGGVNRYGKGRNYNQRSWK